MNNSTDIIIDGYPRSGNSYARAMVLQSNPHLVVTSHLHSYRSILDGAKRGIPTVVLIRSPAECVSSFLQFLPGLPISVAVKEYLRLYSHIRPVARSVVILDFVTLTANPGELATRCNAKFGSNIQPYGKSNANEADVFTMIDNAAYNFAPNRVSQVVGRPDAGRRPIGEVLRCLSTNDRGLMDRAETLYAELTQDPI